ncbi:MAG: FecR family protein [Dysgonomonas sp.]|nr:FecR family protein [Dysgonomonas sp.]
MEKRDYIELLDSFLQGRTSIEEEQILFDWFRTPEAKEEILSSYLNRWENTSLDLSEDVQMRMFENIQDKIAQTEKENQTKPNTLKTYLIRIAAAASILLIVGFSVHYLTRQSIYSSKEFAVSVAKGQKANLTLPDGTLVWLNSDSKIKYDNTYNANDRRLILEGEAYFEVAKEKDKPFIVTTNNIDVQALGTKFNVRSYLEDKDITVTLVEGKLKVNNESSETILNPDERLVYNRQDKLFVKSDIYGASNIAVWRNNELAFYGETLEDVGTVLSRIYNVDIVFTSEKAKEFSFYGVIKNNSLNNVLNIISMTAPIEYRIYNDTIQISTIN